MVLISVENNDIFKAEKKNKYIFFSEKSIVITHQPLRYVIREWVVGWCDGAG